jgi:hypothetical protein
MAVLLFLGVVAVLGVRVLGLVCSGGDEHVFGTVPKRVDGRQPPWPDVRVFARSP